MKFRRTIRREIDHEKDGVNVKGGVNAVVAMNVNEKGSVCSVSSKQRIVQRATNVLSDGAVAYADATQDVDIDRGGCRR